MMEEDLKEEIKFLKKATKDPFIYLVREAKLLLEEEQMILKKGNDREGLIELRKLKMEEIKQINEDLEELKS